MAAEAGGGGVGGGLSGAAAVARTGLRAGRRAHWGERALGGNAGVKAETKAHGFMAAVRWGAAGRSSAANDWDAGSAVEQDHRRI